MMRLVSQITHRIARRAGEGAKDRGEKIAKTVAYVGEAPSNWSLTQKENANFRRVGIEVTARSFRSKV